MQEDQKSRELILEKVARDLPKLAEHLQTWAKSHIIEPKTIILSSDADGKSKVSLWLVTGHTGDKDSSYRVVYDQNSDKFGLECTLKDGTEWYMGPYGSFAEALTSM